MVKYILKRLGLAIIILLGVSIILYFLIRLMPLDFVQQRILQISQNQNPEDLQALIDAMNKQYGLGDNSFKGIVGGYGAWLWKLVRLDLGKTFVDNQPVVSAIADHMGVSFLVAFVAIIFEYLIAIPLGVTAATHQYSVRDYVVTVLVMIGISLPSFFFGRVLQNIFAMHFGWFPPSGYQNATEEGVSSFMLGVDHLWHVILPITVMVLLSIGGTMRYMRTNMLEVLNSDYIRTARAKGLPESKVIYKHAFRNTMIPIVTVMAGILPTLFSGAMITEQVFDLPGIGNYALKAMTGGDIPFIMGYNMFLALLSVIGVLLSDLMYAIVDPRVKLY